MVGLGIEDIAFYIGWMEESEGFGLVWRILDGILDYRFAGWAWGMGRIGWIGWIEWVG